MTSEPRLAGPVTVKQAGLGAWGQQHSVRRQNTLSAYYVPKTGDKTVDNTGKITALMELKN